MANVFVTTNYHSKDDGKNLKVYYDYVPEEGDKIVVTKEKTSDGFFCLQFQVERKNDDNIRVRSQDIPISDESCFTITDKEKVRQTKAGLYKVELVKQDKAYNLGKYFRPASPTSSNSSGS